MNNEFTAPLISIGVVSYDNPTYLDLLLKGFIRNTINPYEVLVHGNCASNAFRTVVNAHPEITHYQESPKNRYIAVPTNEIFEHARGKYFFRVSDDMYPPPKWDEPLLAEMDSENIFKLVSPARYDFPRKRPRNYHDFGTTPENFEEDRFNREYLDHRQWTKNTCHIVGELFMPRALWETTGGYSEKFPRKHDLEFPVRLWTIAGKKINPTCVAAAPFYHFRGSRGNTKASFSGPDNNHMALLMALFGKDVLDEFAAFMAEMAEMV